MLILTRSFGILEFLDSKTETRERLLCLMVIHINITLRIEELSSYFIILRLQYISFPILPVYSLFSESSVSGYHV